MGVDNMRRRCLHDPRNPVLHVRLQHTPMIILKKICERVREFYDTPSMLVCLTSRARKLKSEHARMKSQRREAVVRVLTALLHHTELATMRVGIPTPEGFKPIGVRYFVQFTGLSQSRFERALADINAAGIIKTHERYDCGKGGQYIGLNAVRVVSTHLFTALKLGKYLKSARKKASKKLYALAEKQSVEKIANLTMVAHGVTSTRRPRRKTPPTGDPPDMTDLEVNHYLRDLKSIFEA